ncbi:hypothetical protein ACFFX0_01820 [Citricoccus parietis]|uniref:Uncharacterized protein n=1 Tax=Citricoccus parietis TaxID=592307 RepID=A0ABV5FTP8_9MICC
MFSRSLADPCPASRRFWLRSRRSCTPATVASAVRTASRASARAVADCSAAR